MATYRLYWISEDGQNSIFLGDFPSQAAAESAVERAWRQMRDQGSDDDREWIDAGSIQIEAND